MASVKYSQEHEWIRVEGDVGHQYPIDRRQRHRLVDAVDRRKPDLATLLARCVHRSGGRGLERLDRPVGVPGRVHPPFAGGNPGELVCGGGERRQRGTL